MVDLWVKSTFRGDLDELPRSHVCRVRDHTEPDNVYLSPIYTEPPYAEPFETHGSRSANRPEPNTVSSLLEASTSLNGYITPINQTNSRRYCCNESNKLLIKFLISAFLNVAFIAGLTSSLYQHYKEEFPPSPQPSPLELIDGNRERSKICFLNQGTQCIAGSLTKSTDIQIISNSSKRKVQNEVSSLCCYDKSQSLQQLTRLLLLVKAHNEVKKICRDCPTKHIARTSDISVACRMVTSEHGLLLSDQLQFANDCKDGVRVKKTSLHFLYLFLAVNCSLHGNNVIKAGIKFEDELIAQTEMQCDVSFGEVTLSLFSFRNLISGTKLIPFVSDTKCVKNDTQNNTHINRFEMLAL